MISEGDIEAGGGVTQARYSKALGPSGDLLSSDYMRASPLWSPLDLFGEGSLGEVWEVTQDVGTVDSLVSFLPGRTGYSNFSQLTDANKPTLRKRGDGVCYLDFAGAKYMAAGGAASLFNFLHNGTGGTFSAFIEWPASGSDAKFIVSAPTTSSHGIQIILSAAGFAQVFVCRGTSGVYTVYSSDLRWRPANRGPVLISVSYKNNGSSDDLTITLDDGISPSYTGTANSPSTSDAGQVLSINAAFGGKLYAMLAISRRLSKAEIARLCECWRKKYEYAFRSDVTFIYGGQSNASGRGVIDITQHVPAVGAYTLNKADVYTLTSEPSHSTLNSRVNTSPTEPAVTSPAVSSMLAFQRRLLADYGLQSLGVPIGVGSTDLSQQDTPATVADRLTLFGAGVYRFKKALRDKGGTPFILWAGHESSASLAVPDYTNGGVGTAYQTAFAQLIADYRSAMGNPNIPVFFTQLAPTDGLSASVTQAAAAEAQRQCELSISNAHMIVTHDVLRNASTDDIHVSATGQAVIAVRQALLVEQFLLGKPVNGTGPRIASVSRSGAVITLACSKAINTTAGNYGNLFRAYDNGVEATISSAARHGSDPTKVLITLSATPTGPVTLTYGYRAGLASAARTDIVADSDGLPLPVFGPLLVS